MFTVHRSASRRTTEYRLTFNHPRYGVQPVSWEVPAHWTWVCPYDAFRFLSGMALTLLRTA